MAKSYASGSTSRPADKMGDTIPFPRRKPTSLMTPQEIKKRSEIEEKKYDDAQSRKYKQPTHPLYNPKTSEYEI